MFGFPRAVLYKYIDDRGGDLAVLIAWVSHTPQGRSRSQPPYGLAQARVSRTVTTSCADMVLTEVTAFGSAPNAVN